MVILEGHHENTSVHWTKEATELLMERDVRREVTRTGAGNRLRQSDFDSSPLGSQPEWKRTLGKKTAEHYAMVHSSQC